MEAGIAKKSKNTDTLAPAASFHPAVRWWLLAGIILIVGQVVIGGITRLTESGLSITEWKPLSGAVYPRGEAAWQAEFEKYQASPQYAMIFADISMEDFKFIYFWEWFHRQWARMMGLVFAIGFAFFYYKGYFNSALMKRLGGVVLLAGITASFGWIMVASGLIERPWVNAYKLTMHLSLALLTFGYLVWTSLKVWMPQVDSFPHDRLKNPLILLFSVLIFQILLGGVMSGAKFALAYPTWPDMAGVFLPGVLTNSSAWMVENFVQYDKNPFLPALVQFLHRMTAYGLIFIVLWLSYRSFSGAVSPQFKRSNYLLISLLIIQVLLGIATLVSSIGQVPVGLGVAHQAGAIALLFSTLYCMYLLWPGKPLISVEKPVDNR